MLYSPRDYTTRNVKRRVSTTMRTSELFWKMFAKTGSIKSYLMYRHLHPVQATS